MKYKEIKESSDKNLMNLEKEFKGEILNLSLQLRSGGLKQTSKLSEKKKDLARVKTEMKSRELNKAGGGK